jgi:hypothetical protein
MATPTPHITPAPHDQTKKVMAIIIGLLCGVVAALVAHVLCQHLGGAPLVGLGYSGGSFVALTTLIVMLEKELGLL